MWIVVLIGLLWTGNGIASECPEDETFYRSIQPGALTFHHITHPEFKKCTFPRISACQEMHEEIYVGLVGFVNDLIFLQREEFLFQNRTLYPKVKLRSKTSVIINATDTRYVVQGNPKNPQPEYWRQKTVSFMQDLWRMALGERSTISGPQVLRRLMEDLGSKRAEEGSIKTRSFLEHVNAVRHAYEMNTGNEANEKTADNLAVAAKGLYDWSSVYEVQHALAEVHPEKTRHKIRKSASFSGR